MSISMGRPCKRQRFSDPPELELHDRREQNDLRLKSTFESIFEKYGRDFGGIGDEIDLETGEIIVNNGHILGMANERDPGDLETESEGEESEDWSDGEGVLATSLLSQTRRRIGSLARVKNEFLAAHSDEESPSVDEADSLMGDTDSLMGDTETEPRLPEIGKRVEGTDSLYGDEEEEDELASSELVWPTPKKPTPLSHTPWRMSPLKPLRGHEEPADPAWRTPRLPEIQTPRRKYYPASISQANSNHFGSGPRRSGHSHSAMMPLTPHRPQSLATSLSIRAETRRTHAPIDAIKVLRTQSGPYIESGWWTKAEEDLLRFLKTTTTLPYSEIEKYFHGRRGHDIGQHWKRMLQKDQVAGASPSLRPPRPSTDVSPSPYGPSPRHQTPASAGRHVSPPQSLSPKVRGTVSNIGATQTGDGHAIALPGLTHQQDLMQEDLRPRSDREIPNSTDPTETSEEMAEPTSEGLTINDADSENGESSAAAVLRLNGQARPLEELKVKEEDEQEPIAVTMAPIPIHSTSPFSIDVMSTQASDVASGPPPESAVDELADPPAACSSFLTVPRNSKSRSNTASSSSKESSPQRNRALNSKKAVPLPSDDVDGSDDELSTPVRTVGMPRSALQSENRFRSTQLLSNVVLKRNVSSASPWIRDLRND